MIFAKHCNPLDGHSGLFWIACCLLVGLATPVNAGKYNRTLSIGDAAPAWKGLPDVQGKPHALEDLKKKEVVVVVFTCNSCPYAVAYEDRLIAFAKQHCQGKDAAVALVAINVNKVAEDLPAEMKKRAKEKKFNFPYLYDESQQIAKDYGATYTPEFFVLNKQRKIVYMGAMDDSDDPKKAKRPHVVEAVTRTLAGKPIELQETIAIGCAIRYDRSRRRKRK